MAGYTIDNSGVIGLSRGINLAYGTYLCGSGLNEDIHNINCSPASSMYARIDDLGRSSGMMYNSSGYFNPSRNDIERDLIRTEREKEEFQRKLAHAEEKLAQRQREIDEKIAMIAKAEAEGKNVWDSLKSIVSMARDAIFEKEGEDANEISETQSSEEPVEVVVEQEAPPEPSSPSSSSNPNECKVCYDKSIEYVFMPCRHASCCGECSMALDKCPVCRQVVDEMIKIYIS